MTGDVMFVLGAFAEEHIVPVGASFAHRGMSNHQHDAVAAQLLIPIGRRGPRHTQPGTGGDSQPATAATSSGQAKSVAATAREEAALPQLEAGRPAADGAPEAALDATGSRTPCARRSPSHKRKPDALPPTQPEAGCPAAAESAAEQATETQDGAYEESVCWSPDTVEDYEAEMLHAELRVVEEADDVPADIQRELGKILFKKRSVTTGGITRQYVSPPWETLSSIKKLLKRRRDFMAARNLRDEPPAAGGAAQPAGTSGGAAQAANGRYIFNEHERQLLMQEWKDAAVNGRGLKDGGIVMATFGKPASKTWPPLRGHQH